MTNKQKAQELWAIVKDLKRPAAERQTAHADLIDLKKSAKCSYEKLGVTQVMIGETLLIPGVQIEPKVTVETDPLEEKVTKPIVKAQQDSKPLPKDSRGLITAEVKRLLGTDMPYADIVAAVVAKFPEAKTTARSVASTASDMRKANLDVPQRRAPAEEASQ